MKLAELIKLIEPGSHFCIQDDYKIYHFYDPEDIKTPEHEAKLNKEILSIWHAPHLYATIVIKLM